MQRAKGRRATRSLGVDRRSRLLRQRALLGLGAVAFFGVGPRHIHSYTASVDQPASCPMGRGAHFNNFALRHAFNVAWCRSVFPGDRSVCGGLRELRNQTGSTLLQDASRRYSQRGAGASISAHEASWDRLRGCNCNAGQGSRYLSTRSRTLSVPTNSG